MYIDDQLVDHLRPLQHTLADPNLSTVEKFNAVVKYVNQFDDVQERSDIICDIINTGKFLHPMNATSIATLAAKCEIDAIGAVHIADNIYGISEYNPARERFIGFYKIEKINVDQQYLRDVERERQSPGVHFHPIEGSKRLGSPTVGRSGAGVRF